MPGPKGGRPTTWGADRSPMTLKWPVAHRRRYEREAALRGLSLTEYVIRFMAIGHELADPHLMPDGPDVGQLRLSDVPDLMSDGPDVGLKLPAA